MKIDWQQMLLELRRHYKPLKCIAYEIGSKPKTVQCWARRGVKVMQYEMGVLLVALHDKHVKGIA